MQFLLNADGSLPPGTNLAALLAAGVRLTLPVPPHAPAPGMQVVDLGDGEKVGDIWHQKWTEVAAPEQPVSLAELNKAQFARLLAVQPLRGVLRAVEAVLEVSDAPADQELYADLQGYKNRDVFPFDLTMGIVGRFAPYLPDGVTLDADTIALLWLEAAAF